MGTSSWVTPARAVPTTQSSPNAPPDNSPYTAITASTASTLPLTIGLPPPNLSLPNQPPPPPPPPLISAGMTPTSTSNTTTSNNTSPTPSTHCPSATVPASVPSSGGLKLQSQISTLQSRITNTQRSLDDALAKLQDQISRTATVTPSECLSGPSHNEPDLQAQAEAIVKRHIKLLHAYNEIKDVGQGLMGLIADARGVRLKDVMEEMGIGEKD